LGILHTLTNSSILFLRFLNNILFFHIYQTTLSFTFAFFEFE
jgi:hypothetical protein